MKKRNDIKKVPKRIKKSEDSKFNKRRNQNEVDLWKEIRTNLKPLVKAYNKFSEKRRIAKQRDEERKLKENEKQRLREEEALKLQEKEDEKQRLREEEVLRLQEEEEKRFKRQKKAKEQRERRFQEQEIQRLEEKRIKDEHDERIRQKQIYRERLAKGEEERIKQLKKVNEAREEERKLKEERNSVHMSKFDEKPNSEEKENILKEEENEHRLKEREQRLKEQEQRLKEQEQRLKEKEQILKDDSKINEKVENKSNTNDVEKKKRLNGTVLWFSNVKGYGFIRREDKGRDVFVHLSAAQDSGLNDLSKDDQLTFEVEDSDKGLSAVNIQKVTNDDVSRSYLKVIK